MRYHRKIGNGSTNRRSASLTSIGKHRRSTSRHEGARNEIEALTREIQRLQDAKRRALSLADERAKEGNELRLENEGLRARLEECHRS